MDVLSKLESIPVDEKDRPEREIKIKQIQVFVDPFEEYQRRLKNKLTHEANAERENEEMRKRREKEEKMGWFGPSVPKSQTSGGGGGKKKKKMNGSLDNQLLERVINIKKPKSLSASLTFKK